MPEGLEAEIWRSALEVTVGRTISEVWTDDRVADPDIAGRIVGETITAVCRHGKVVVVETSGPALGLHFGMTGRVIVDGRAPIEHLEYASKRDRPEWDRLRAYTHPQHMANGQPAIRMNDPRRLGRVTLDPDTSRLGVDIFAIDLPALTAALSGRRSAIKTALLDQHVVAGLGNLCADEVLWWAGIAPVRTADSLRPDDTAALTTAIRRRLPIMLRRGGSTHGTLTPEVRAGPGSCPRDGTPMDRMKVGGRTAVWCPQHQS